MPISLPKETSPSFNNMHSSPLHFFFSEILITFYSILFSSYGKSINISSFPKDFLLNVAISNCWQSDLIPYFLALLARNVDLPLPLQGIHKLLGTRSLVLV